MSNALQFVIKVVNKFDNHIHITQPSAKYWDVSFANGELHQARDVDDDRVTKIRS